MPSYTGTVTSGVKHAGHTWAWMNVLLCGYMNWQRVETGTLNIRLEDYIGYTNTRRVDFLIPHTTSPAAAWDCYFQRCAITANGKKVDAVIATTGDNFWGKQNGTIEVLADVKLRTVLGVQDQSPAVISI
jgi:CTP-dependent riboflavin kinase